METLFSKNFDRPLPYRLSPENFEEFVGQEHIIGKGKPLRKLIERNKLFSSIFFGPPGTGKTALARLISRLTNAEFIEINAVTSTVQDIREALEKGRKNAEFGKKTILFIDEIHRFNKAQQDALLPDVEAGNVILIGASTENPFFSLTPALRSRTKIYEFKPLTEKDLKKLYELAVNDKRGLKGFSVPQEVLKHLIESSAGDGRKFLTYLEELYVLSEGKTPNLKLAEEVTGRTAVIYDKGDNRYDIISAFIKSIRGSDPDAAIYYLARMIKGGEDPLFIARRLVISASEDIGNANPLGLLVATAALEAVKNVGMPEAAINLAHATVFLACSPKSDSSYRALKKALKEVEKGLNLPVPQHLKSGFKNKGYKNPHRFPRHWVKQEYLTEKRKYYESSHIGYEKILDFYMKWMKSRLSEQGGKEDKQ